MKSTGYSSESLYSEKTNSQIDTPARRDSKSCLANKSPALSLAIINLYPHRDLVISCLHTHTQLVLYFSTTRRSPVTSERDQSKKSSRDNCDNHAKMRSPIANNTHTDMLSILFVVRLICNSRRTAAWNISSVCPYTMRKRMRIREG